MAGDLAALDAVFADRQGAWWDDFYADRTKPVPFFGAGPDASLWRWVTTGAVARRGRALDIGCGNGRNAVFLAQCGFDVDAVDYAEAAIAWAGQRAAAARVHIRLHHASVFDLSLAGAGYDLIYDSGCFHHMPPHRRLPYVELVAGALAPQGHFGMACFRPEGGSGLTDAEVYQRKTLGGGLGYSREQLQAVWSGRLAIEELCVMDEAPADSGLFSAPFLWALLARKAQLTSPRRPSPQPSPTRGRGGKA